MESKVSGGAASALSPGHVGAGRRRRSAKKLRLVKKSTVRRMLKSRGLKMRGGEPNPGETSPEGGRRRRKSHGRRSHRKSRRGSMLRRFGF